MMIDVADSSDGRHTPFVHAYFLIMHNGVSPLSPEEAEDDPVALSAQDGPVGAGALLEVAALTRVPLDVMNERPDRQSAHRIRVTFERLNRIFRNLVIGFNQIPGFHVFRRQYVSFEITIDH